MEYLGPFLAFAAAMVGVRGDTWKGRRPTAAGVVASVIALAALVVGGLSAHGGREAKQAVDRWRAQSSEFQREAASLLDQLRAAQEVERALLSKVEGLQQQNAQLLAQIDVRASQQPLSETRAISWEAERPTILDERYAAGTIFRIIGALESPVAVLYASELSDTPEPELRTALRHALSDRGSPSHGRLEINGREVCYSLMKSEHPEAALIGVPGRRYEVGLFGLQAAEHKIRLEWTEADSRATSPRR